MKVYAEVETEENVYQEDKILLISANSIEERDISVNTDSGEIKSYDVWLE